MDLLVRRVRRAIHQHELIGPGARVLVAVSGGADSVALLLVLAELAADAREVRLRRTTEGALPDFDLAGIIHVHHGLRGIEADGDDQFVRALADRMGLTIEVSRVDVQAEMLTTGHSLEVAARELRYRAFADAAGRMGATVVATGHTADDQAETVLLRLLRGTTTRGLGAIRAKRGPYIRPLLGCRRAQLRRYLDGCGQAYREDSSNADETLTRNRLRHHVMPAIESDWPGGVPALGRFAHMAVDDERCLSEQAELVVAKAIRQDANGVQVQVEVLSALHPAVARRVVRRALEAAGGITSFRSVEAVRRLSTQEVGQIRLQGLVAEKRGECVWLRREYRARATTPFDYELPVPGTVEISETHAVLKASLYTGDQIPLLPGTDRAVVQQSALPLPLRVRGRRTGDRFRPLGAPGTRKLQDVLVDRKVPKNERDAVPVVVDAQGRIVWVAGVAAADEYRVTSPKAGMVILDLKKGNQ